jgi:hypothetical protein
MSSIETLAQRVQKKGGNLDVQFKYDRVSNEYWVINISLLKPPFFDSMTCHTIVGGRGESLNKVANKANGAFK